ncbi:DUF2786 domain-containing protein [Rudaeicoccus suwonensis]|uniref:Uncharacterized protein DUF2786 n=1 Tax=Rudaeicoccus suwonensis TaxID=657409 RepID=A0A561E828_9MICO|nr:DUF2786 domain-containing protein [Rudaeicoccus suwonensis]TWE11773.1 uncharacterized protein DUF2786 [Rudaeicoccus suwonensis]
MRITTDSPAAGFGDTEQIQQQIWHAVACLNRRALRQFDDQVGHLVVLADSATGCRSFGMSARDLLRGALAAAWRGGWQPADLHRYALRKLEASDLPVLADAIADELSTYAAATIDEHWHGQLRELDAETWWSPDVSFIEARRRNGLGSWALTTTTIKVLHFLTALPQLEVLGPLPGQATPRDTSDDAASTQVREVDERILSRVRALLAKAESTTFEAEAETFTAGAQALMARHSIDAALLAADQKAPTAPGARRIGVENPYESAKALLLSEIADANRCRAVWFKQVGFCTVVGHRADVDAVETLFTSLLVQATHAMTREGSRSDGQGRSRTKSFRASFLQGFAVRIGERLTDVTRAEADAVAGDESRSGGRDLVPLLAQRAAEVDAAFQAMFPALVHRRVRAGQDAEGWHSGAGAADRARLGGTGIEGRAG